MYGNIAISPVETKISVLAAMEEVQSGPSQYRTLLSLAVPIWSETSSSR